MLSNKLCLFFLLASGLFSCAETKTTTETYPNGNLKMMEKEKYRKEAYFSIKKEYYENEVLKSSERISPFGYRFNEYNNSGNMLRAYSGRDVCSIIIFRCFNPHAYTDGGSYRYKRQINSGDGNRYLEIKGKYLNAWSDSKHLKFRICQFDTIDNGRVLSMNLKKSTNGVIKIIKRQKGRKETIYFSDEKYLRQFVDSLYPTALGFRH